ncbi:transposase [Paenibacillus sp. GSMTC-2017]|uniref:transposase n=1 Tax=Paenibacillus sp. GSMTC-2017 TaxID=2794350 RepID=UPI0018D9FE80|nr:transposase [Paenibacillus sp. GSMTC-2017]MBH5320749.1 transposase [Paenibacillus sp. GSMTC-2017]
MKQSLSEQKNATIYQYQLVKRVFIHSELIISHLITGAIFVAFQMLFYQMDGLFSALLGFAIVQFLHLLILLLTFIRVDEAVDRQWIWRINPPWIGFKPANEIKLSLFRRVHRQLFWVGLCLIALLYPWLSASMMISLVCWHMWLIVPRMLLSFVFRKQRKDGVLRLQTKEASYYHR